MEKIVEIKNLSFSYDDNIILENINYTICNGDFIAVIGPNGGGKTTLLKLVAGILRPTKGEIVFYSQSEIIEGLKKYKVNRVGYVPQDISFNKDFPISVTDVVMLGRYNHQSKLKRASKRNKEIVNEALSKLEMWNFRNKKIGELSGGQRQRVLIARALVTEPKLLLFDEPTANVDIKGQTKLYEILDNINKDLAIMVVSHELSTVSKFVKSIACLNKTLVSHDSAEITEEMLEHTYGKLTDGKCPIDLIAHGLPHRVLRTHKEGEEK